VLPQPVLGTTCAVICLPDAAFSADERESLTTDSIALAVHRWELIDFRSLFRGSISVLHYL